MRFEQTSGSIERRQADRVRRAVVVAPRVFVVTGSSTTQIAVVLSRRRTIDIADTAPRR